MVRPLISVPATISALVLWSQGCACRDSKVNTMEDDVPRHLNYWRTSRSVPPPPSFMSADVTVSHMDDRGLSRREGAVKHIFSNYVKFHQMQLQAHASMTLGIAKMRLHRHTTLWGGVEDRCVFGSGEITRHKEEVEEKISCSDHETSCLKGKIDGLIKILEVSWPHRRES